MALSKLSSVLAGVVMGLSLVGCGPEDLPTPELNAEVGNVEQAVTLAATSTNLSKLQNGCYSGSYLLWSGCTNSGSSLDVAYKASVAVAGVTGTVLSDNYGGYTGECVSLVKAVAKNNATTSQWGRGVNVVANGGVAPGAAIATFFGTNGTYYGHAAIFAGYIRDAAGAITGIRVYDQNWSARAVTSHNILRSGTAGTVNDADSYHVIQVP